MAAGKYDHVKQLIREGKRAEARAELSAMVRADPQDADAWYGLSQVIDDPEKKRYCLERAHQLRPDAIAPAVELNRAKAAIGQAEPVSKRAKTINQIIGCLGVLAVFMICIGMASTSGSGEPKPTATPTVDFPSDLSAVSMCRQFMEDRLKAPATAQYPSRNTASVSHSGKTFTVTTYVDAENSFGAMLRITFRCKMEYRGNDYWKLIDMQTSED